MGINELKKAVYAAFSSARMTDELDEQMISCIVYDLVKRVISTDAPASNDARSIAQGYIPFVSYSQMRTEVESFGHSTFLGFTARQISRINELYMQRIEVKPFSSVYFSQYMYRLSDVPQADYERLASVHKRLMAPIAKFYSDQYGKQDSDLEVFTALGYTAGPGKEIVFSVKGIDPARVASDIKTSRIPVQSPRDYQAVRAEGRYVRIIT